MRKLQPKITDEARKKVVLALQRVWDEIADDYFQAAAEHGGKEPRQRHEVRLRRSEVAEAALDAGRAVQMGYLTQDEYVFFLDLPTSVKDAVKKEAFPDRWYSY